MVVGLSVEISFLDAAAARKRAIWGSSPEKMTGKTVWGELLCSADDCSCVSFVSILELAKARVVKIMQAKRGDELYISKFKQS